MNESFRLVFIRSETLNHTESGFFRGALSTSLPNGNWNVLRLRVRNLQLEPLSGEVRLPTYLIGMLLGAATIQNKRHPFESNTEQTSTSSIKMMNG